MWTKDGTWARILDEVIVKDDSVGDVEWVISVDSSVVRAISTRPEPGKGLRRRDRGPRGRRGRTRRSRGGLSTKIHLAADGSGLPMRVLLTAGQAGDTRPTRIPTRQALRRRGITFVSPERTDQIAHRAAKGAHGGRPPAFDTELNKQRNVVERCFNRLRQFRDLATRYAKRVAYYQAELTNAAIVPWLR